MFKRKKARVTYSEIYASGSLAQLVTDLLQSRAFRVTRTLTMLVRLPVGFGRLSMPECIGSQSSIVSQFPQLVLSQLLLQIRTSFGPEPVSRGFAVTSQLDRVSTNQQT